MKLPLHWKIIIGLFLGVVWALVSGYFGFSSFTIDYIGPFGNIFINLLKLIAVPMILFSIIKGVSEISDIGRLGKIGFKTLGLYIFTTIVAVTLGLVIVNLFKPGTFVDKNAREVNRISYELWAKDNNIIPADGKNFLADTKYQNLIVEAKKNYIQLESGKSSEQIQSAEQTKNQSPLQMLVDIVPSNIFNALSGSNYMLQVIFFAIFFGVVLVMIDAEKAEPVIKLFDGMNEVFLKMVDIVMKAAPFFVFALLAGKISEMAPNNPEMMLQIFKGLGWYSLVVIFGLLFITYIFYPLLLKLLSKNTIGYFEFFKAIGKAQSVAFSTSSSAATLPVTIDCVNNNLKVPKEVSSFVLPIGATVNMDGTSLYISVAVVFLAQLHLIDLSVGQQVIIVLTATMASIGASAVPSAGLIMMIMVLQSVGLNPAWIAIIFPVDRILDMCRTVVNVTGDTVVAKIVSDLD